MVENPHRGGNRARGTAGDSKPRKPAMRAGKKKQKVKRRKWALTHLVKVKREKGRGSKRYTTKP